MLYSLNDDSICLLLQVRTETSPHPIWGAQIQVVSRLSLTTPSGKTKVMDYEHEASLTHQNNPLTATKIAKTIKVRKQFQFLEMLIGIYIYIYISEYIIYIYIYI